MKQYVKILSRKSSECFEYANTKFPKITEVKVKVGNINRFADTGAPPKDNFIKTRGEIELKARNHFKYTYENVLCNKRSQDFRNGVKCPLYLDLFGIRRLLWKSHRG